MPTINISPKVRFVLYLSAVIGGLFVQYAMDKSFFGDAEFRLWSGIATLLMLLAAAKTNLADATAQVKGTVVSESGETGQIRAVVSGPDEESDLVDDPDVDSLYDGAYEGQEGVIVRHAPDAAPEPYNPEADDPQYRPH